MPFLSADRRSTAWLLVALAAALPACLPDNNHVDPASLGTSFEQAGQSGASSGTSGHGGSAAGAGGQGLAGSSAGAAGDPGTMPVGGSGGSAPSSGGTSAAGSEQGQAGSEPGNQAGSGQAGSGTAGSGQEQPPTNPTSGCQVGAYAGDTSLPEAPACSCINHTYQNDEQIMTVNGAPILARFLSNGTMYAWHSTESGVGAPKPGHWLGAAGFPPKCARRFAEAPGDGPVETWTTPAPLAAPTRCYSSGETVCVDKQQGTIYVKQTAWGQRYLCRSYPGQSFEECGFVPGEWSGIVCNETPENAQQFLDGSEDPAKAKPCGT